MLDQKSRPEYCQVSNGMVLCRVTWLIVGAEQVECESAIILKNYESNCEKQQPSKGHWEKQMCCHHS
jgi:hypothetical protein